MDILLAGFTDIFTISNLTYIFLGILLGNIIGAIPGLNAVMAMAIAVPLTFYMPTIGAIGFLVGLNKGTAFGGSISAIIMNIPGSPDAAATCFDGYPMYQQGKGLKALKISLVASVFGDFFSTFVLILIAAPIAGLAIKLGPAELCALMIFALILIADLESKHLAKGILAAAFGLLLSTIGLEPVSSQPRLTFGFYQLENGIPLSAVAIGLLAMSEVLQQVTDKPLSTQPQHSRVNLKGTKKEDRNLSMREFIGLLPTLIRSSIIGVIVGIMPGLGGTVSAFLGYGVEKKYAKQPEKFGQGCAEGVAAPEAANNSVICANLIPLFTLGIPGSVTSALLIGAFIIHGITPGPLMFETHTQTVYGIYMAMMLGNGLNLVIGYLGLHLFVRMLSLSTRILYPVIIFFCLIGAQITENNFTGLMMTVVFMCLGLFMKQFGFSFVSFIIGFVLGPLLELYMQQTIISGNGNLSLLFTRPLACLLMVLSAIIIIRRLVLLIQQARSQVVDANQF